MPRPSVSLVPLPSLLSLGLPLLVACGPAERPVRGPDAETSAAASAPDAPPDSSQEDTKTRANSGPATTSTTAHTSAPSEPPKPPPRERVRLHNECSKPMKLHIERQSDADLDTSLGNSTSMEERAKDGDEIWLRDDKNNTIDKIVITAAMREVTIQSGCLKLGSH